MQQIRRCSSSIAANIAESCGKNTLKHKVQTLYVAMGEIKEPEYFLILSRDLRYVEEIDIRRIESKLSEVGMMLSGLIKTFSHEFQNFNKRTTGYPLQATD